MVTQNPQSSSTRVDLFEQKIIFRTARAFFVVIALLAVLIFVGGSLLGLTSLMPKEVPAPALPTPVAPPAPLTYAQVLETLAKKAQEPPPEPEEDLVVRKSKSDASAEDPIDVRIRELVVELQGLLPEPRYSWNDVVARVCTYPSPYGCLAYQNRTQTKGMRSVVVAAIEQVPERDVVPALEALVKVLKEAPEEARGELILPTVQTWLRLNRDFLRAQAAQHALIEQQTLEHRQKVAEAEAARALLQTQALQGMFVGFAAVILVSLFLAFLAMERHMRRMETLLGAVTRTESVLAESVLAESVLPVLVQPASL